MGIFVLEFAGGGPELASGWNPAASNSVSPYGGFSVFLREDDNKLGRNGNGGNLTNGGFMRGRGRVRPEAVIESATFAANGQPFEVIYYRRASTPEFCVKASSVVEAMRIQWCLGMRFKMAFETEDSSRISWFMGTISSVQVADPRWPSSPWRLLQVTWDEPDLLQNVKRVSPWLVELVPNMPPAIHMSPFSPPRKKLRLSHHPDFLFNGQFQIPSLSSNPLGPSSPMCCLSDNTPAGIQGARHAQFGTSLSDFHSNKLHSVLFQSGLQRLHVAPPSSRISAGITMGNQNNSNHNSDENVSCLLTMGSSTQSSKKPGEKKTAQFVLFGQPILTEQQISLTCSGGPVSPVLTGNSSSDGNLEKTANFSDASGSAFHQNGRPDNFSSKWYKDHQTVELGLETGHCKVFMESEDVGRTLDLSVLRSYEELYKRLANMFGIERSEMLGRVLYRDANGDARNTGDESFSDFVKAARRLTILMDSGSDNIGR